jgi:hypothetical protein
MRRKKYKNKLSQESPLKCLANFFANFLIAVIWLLKFIGRALLRPFVSRKNRNKQKK